MEKQTIKNLLVLSFIRTALSLLESGNGQGRRINLKRMLSVMLRPRLAPFTCIPSANAGKALSMLLQIKPFSFLTQAWQSLL